MKKISFIIPCYNEENNVIIFYKKIQELYNKRINNIELIFIDDGSRDNTLKNLKSLDDKCKNIKIISFLRNFGKEAAILAGLKVSNGEYSVIIDADLQQNPKYVLEMEKVLDENSEYDVVCCVQEKRKENIIKRALKKSFYKVLDKMMEVEIINAASDFRLMRRNVVEAIINLPEKIRFSKGIFAWVGFNTYYMPYEVEERNSGKSKWSLSKLFKYAFDGIISFSNVPLIFLLKFGIFLLIISLAFLITFLVLLSIGMNLPIMEFIIIDSILFLSSCILISNGIIGKYLANTYTEIKNRPLYIVKEFKTYDKKD